MITVENDYEPIVYEQPFTSHIYENQLELLNNYHIGTSHTTQTTQEVKEINTVIKPDEKDETQCSNTKHIYQNIQKEYVPICQKGTAQPSGDTKKNE